MKQKSCGMHLTKGQDYCEEPHSYRHLILSNNHFHSSHLARLVIRLGHFLGYCLRTDRCLRRLFWVRNQSYDCEVIKRMHCGTSRRSRTSSLYPVACIYRTCSQQTNNPLSSTSVCTQQLASKQSQIVIPVLPRCLSLMALYRVLHP